MPTAVRPPRTRHAAPPECIEEGTRHANAVNTAVYKRSGQVSVGVYAHCACIIPGVRLEGPRGAGEARSADEAQPGGASTRVVHASGRVEAYCSRDICAQIGEQAAVLLTLAAIPPVSSRAPLWARRVSTGGAERQRGCEAFHTCMLTRWPTIYCRRLATCFPRAKMHQRGKSLNCSQNNDRMSPVQRWSRCRRP